MYAGADEFVERTLPFVERGLDAGASILVAVGADKICRLRAALNGSADRVEFADMAEIGANPARIIPFWAEFVAEHRIEGRATWGIGEPIWPERSPAELIECQLHESLLNLAFADSEGFTLLCPYDSSSLPADVIEAALHSHPCAQIEGESHPSESYRPMSWLEGPFDEPLPEPDAAIEKSFDDDGDLAAIRDLVADSAARSGADADRRSALVLAVHEAAANSLVHGGGSGSVRIWPEGPTLICEVRDRGCISDPLVGRVRPSRTALDGRGVWLIQQLADLAQIRSDAHGTAVRIHLTV